MFEETKTLTGRLGMWASAMDKQEMRGLPTRLVSDLSEAKAEIERLRSEIGRLTGIYRAAGDAAYGDYIAIMSRDVCKGADFKMENGKFGPEELRGHNSASEALGKHRACVSFVQALNPLQPVT